MAEERKTDEQRRPKRRRIGRGLVFAIAGATLYVFAPAVLEVFSSWDQVSKLRLRWFVAVGLAQAAAVLAAIALQRLALGSNKWGPVVTSQLAGSAAGRMVPGGGATGAAVQFKLLRDAGIETRNASVGLAATGLLQLVATLALPVVAIPSIVVHGSELSGLLPVALSALSLFVVLIVPVVLMFVNDRPLVYFGRLVDFLRSVIPLMQPGDRLTGTRLLATRDEVRTEFGPKLGVAVLLAVIRTLFDYLSLVLAMRAFGLEVNLGLLLAVFGGATLLAMIPLTPGGLGFVETGLTGGLVVLGVPSAAAVSVALLYRLFSFWFPIPIGVLAGLAHRLRYQL